MVHSKGREIGRAPSRTEDEGCVWSEAVENAVAGFRTKDDITWPDKSACP